MIIERKVIQLDKSFVITLPKEMLGGVEKGDKIVLSVKYLGKADTMVEYECKMCNLVFSREEDEDLYCPSCGNENKKMIE